MPPGGRRWLLSAILLALAAGMVLANISGVQARPGVPTVGGAVSLPPVGGPVPGQGASSLGLTVATVPGVDAAYKLQVSWNLVTNANGYRVQWKTGSQQYVTSERSVNKGSSATSHTIAGLAEDTAYNVRVTALPESLAVAEEVTGTKTLPAITGLSFHVAGSATDMEVWWRPVTGAAGYVLQWRKEREADYDNTRRILIGAGEVEDGWFQKNVADLTAGTKYYFLLRYYTSAGSAASPDGHAHEFFDTTFAKIYTASISAATAEEGDDLTFTVTLNEPNPDAYMSAELEVLAGPGDTATVTPYSVNPNTDLWLSYEFNNRLTGSVPFFAGETTSTVTIKTVEDNIAEGDETFTVRISSSEQLAAGSNNTVTGTIIDDDGPPTHVTLDLSTSWVAEKGGPQTVTVNAALMSCTTFDEDTTITLSLDAGSATENIDYRASGPGRITIPAQGYDGQATFTIIPVDDGAGDSGETVTIGGTVAGGNRSPGIAVVPATLEIIEANSASIADATAREGGDLSFTVTLRDPAAVATRLDYVASVEPGNSASLADFEPASGTLTFAVGETTKTIIVSSTQDTMDENSETFTVTLSNPSVRLALSDATGIGTITDDDAAPLGIALSLSPARVSETDEYQDVIVTATVRGATTFASDKSVAVTVADGTAGSADYTAVPGGTIPIFGLQVPGGDILPITIPAGETGGETIISINAADDGISDSGETVLVSGDLAGVTVTGATLTIEESTFSIADASATEGSAITFTVTRSPAATTATSVRYATSIAAGDSAESADFTATGGTLNFAAGDTQKTFSVTTAGDSDGDDETFTVSLSAPRRGEVLLRPRATGTINDNDAPLRFLNSIHTHVVYTGSAVSYAAPAVVNAAGDTVTYSVSASPATDYGLTFDAASRTISGTLNSAATSPTVIRYTVSGSTASGRQGSTKVSLLVVANACGASTDTTWHPFGNSSVSAETTRDCNVLMAAKDTLRGTAMSMDWGLNVRMDRWKGVTVDRSSNRVSLLLLIRSSSRLSARLQGQISPLLGGLDALEGLSVDTGVMTGEIPPELGALRNLTHLSLRDRDTNVTRRGNLSGVIPPELGDLSKMVQLRLVDLGPLTGGIPPELGRLSQMEELLLLSMPLGGTIPPELGRLASLRKLYLRNIQLTGALPEELSRLTGLRELDLGPYLDPFSNEGKQYLNQLSGPIPPWIGDFTEMTALKLNDNAFSGPVPAEFGKLSKLFSLDLERNQLSGHLPAEFVNFGSAASPFSLHLEGNRLTAPARIQVTPRTMSEGDGPVRVRVTTELTDPAVQFVNSFTFGSPDATGEVTHTLSADGPPVTVAPFPDAEPSCGGYNLDPGRSFVREPVFETHDYASFIITPTHDGRHTGDRIVTFALDATAREGIRLEAPPVTVVVRDDDRLRVIVSPVSGTTSELLVSWQAEPGATGYRVEYKTGSGAYAEVSRDDPAALTETVTGLTAGTLYTVKVTSYSGVSPDFVDGHSNEGTGSTYGELGAVTVNPVPGTATELSASWPAVPGSSGYRVEYRTGGDPYTAVNRDDPTAVTEIIIDLAAETSYTVQVTALYGNGPDFVDGDSNQGTGSTNPWPPGSAGGGPSFEETAEFTRLSAVPVSDGSSLCPASLQVSWNRVRGASLYRVSWGLASSGAFDEWDVTEATQFLVYCLDEDTAYRVEVQALRGDAVLATATTTGRTHPPGPDPEPRLTGLSTAPVPEDSDLCPASLRVSWNPLRGASLYRVSWGPSSGALAGSDVTEASRYQISCLEADTEYRVEVQALRGDAVLAAASTTRRTHPAGPDPDPQLTGLSAVPITEGEICPFSLMASWNPMRGVGLYRVSWGLASSDAFDEWDFDITEATQYQLYCLEADTEYRVEVQALRGDEGEVVATATTTGRTYAEIREQE